MIYAISNPNNLYILCKTYIFLIYFEVIYFFHSFIHQFDSLKLLNSDFWTEPTSCASFPASKHIKYPFQNDLIRCKNNFLVLSMCYLNQITITAQSVFESLWWTIFHTHIRTLQIPKKINICYAKPFLETKQTLCSYEEKYHEPAHHILFVLWDHIILWASVLFEQKILQKRHKLHFRTLSNFTSERFLRAPFQHSIMVL